MTTEAQKRADRNWKKNNTKIITLRLFYKNDQDIIDYLDSIDRKREFIRQAIRNEINRQKG